MNDDLAIRTICNLPIDFRSGSKSAYDLIRTSGIGFRSLTTTEVLPVLQSNPSLIDEWMLWSEDQRCTPAYYFRQESDEYSVGRLPEQEQVKFDDRFSACADFIVKVVNLIW
jgi:hypothetical protein